jgi:hypothetical protein
MMKKGEMERMMMMIIIIMKENKIKVEVHRNKCSSQKARLCSMLPRVLQSEEQRTPCFRQNTGKPHTHL